MAKNSLIFTPSLFFQYSMCPHWIWHDRFSDWSERGELPELTVRLFEQGVLHEEEYIKNLDFIEIKEKNPEKAFSKTLELMKKGINLIYQGEIQFEQCGVIYRGRPDLLEKKIGKSNFGNYYYAPIDIKSSKEIKKEQKMQQTLYSMILEKIQDIYPENISIVNRDYEKMVEKITEKDKEGTLDCIDKILEIMRGKKPPLKLTSEYKNTPWFDKCVREVEAVDDIALIYKLDSRALEALRNIGIRTVHDAAEMKVEAMPKIPYASSDMLKLKKLQAQSLINKQLIWLGALHIPEASLKIYFDIEGDPLLNIQYLFGFWIVGDSQGEYAKIGNVVFDKKEKKYFLYFLAEKPEDETRMWQDFLKWIDILPSNDYYVYHYADYERARTKNLADKYGSSDGFINFSSKYVDFAKIVMNSIIFPLYFYSIKDIAKSNFLHYKWRHEKAGGAQSIFWYEKWLETGDRKVLQDIIDYNEDDVIATEYLHKWLLENYKLNLNNK